MFPGSAEHAINTQISLVYIIEMNELWALITAAAVEL
jgi:hypothetical protein